MEDYTEGLDDNKQEDNVVEMDEMNDNFDDIWGDEKPAGKNKPNPVKPEPTETNAGEDDSANNKNGGNNREFEGEDDSDYHDPNAGGNESDDDSDADDESADGDGEEYKLELELVEKPDEELVAAVETLFMADQLNLEEDKIKELFDGTKEGYERLMQANKIAGNNMAIEQIYNTLPERGKEFFNYLVKTNMQGDIDGWLKLESKSRDLSQYDINNLSEEQAKAILEEDFTAKGLNPKQVKVMIEALEDNDEIADESKKILKDKLAQHEVTKKSKLDAEVAAAALKKQTELKKHQEVVKHINATKFAVQKQEELYNMIYNVSNGSTQPVLVARINEIIKNKPEQLVQLAQLFDGYDDEKGFNLLRLKKQVEADTTKKTKVIIQRKSKQSLKGNQTRHSRNATEQSLDDWLGDDDL